MINDLRQRGFAPAGRMVFKKDGLGLVDAPPMVTTAVGVYAFVIDETEIAYIGSSTRNLAGRIYMHGFSFGYEKVNPVDARMRPLLEAGSRIDVWVCINPMVSWNGEMLDGSLAVEQYLIGRFQPPWNTMHRKRGARSGVAATSCFAK